MHTANCFEITLILTDSVSVTGMMNRKTAFSQDSVASVMRSEYENDEKVTSLLIAFFASTEKTVFVSKLDEEGIEGTLNAEWTNVWMFGSTAETVKTVTLSWRTVETFLDRETSVSQDDTQKLVTQGTYNPKYKDNIVSFFLQYLKPHGDYIVVDKNDYLVNEDSFFSGFNCTKTLYVTKTRDAYDSIAIPAFLQHVYIEDAVIPTRITSTNCKRSAFDAELDSDSSSFYINQMTQVYMQKDVHIEDVLDQVKMVILPSKLDEWNQLLDLVFNKMQLLNKTYVASAPISKDARRLLINEIMVAIACFTDSEWCVDSNNIFSSTKQGELGWGLIDYILRDNVIGHVAVDEIEEERLMKLIYLNNDDEDDDNIGYEGDATKITFNDVGLTQLGCQMYDCLIKNYRKNDAATSVFGVLCTGHQWLYFSLNVDKSTPNTKPIFRFHGETVMRVLRNTLINSDRYETVVGTVTSSAKRRGHKKPRPSSMFSNEFNVSKNEVETVMLTLLACTNGLLK